MKLRRQRTPIERRFYLVQRIKRMPWAEAKTFYEQFGPKVVSNPFGSGGRWGDYELEYMGAAEFEFGTVPKANNRLAEARKDLRVGQHEYNGFLFDFLWIGAEGEPFDDFDRWARGERSRPFWGKETPYRLREVVEEGKPIEDCTTSVWWSLLDNVQFAFAGTDEEPGHLYRMIESMREAPVRLR